MFTRKPELAYSYAINSHKEAIPESCHAEKMSGGKWLDAPRMCNGAVSLRAPEKPV